jgi:hypothetical protein
LKIHKLLSEISQKRIYILFGLFSTCIVFSNVNCSTPSTSRGEKVEFYPVLESEQGGISGEKLSRAELEDAILRFEGRFISQISDAFHPLGLSSSNAIRRQAMRTKLNYSAYSLAISLGAIPEQNLLDMIVFIDLIRDVFRDHWLPHVFKDEGKPVLAALEKASINLEKLASHYLSPAQIAEVKGMVDAWHHQNPNIIAVETVRLSDFSAKAGARATQIKNQISGLLAPVKGATVAADLALTLGERGLFYAQRAPFLIRMQSTAAVQDILNEVESTLDLLPLSPDDLKQIHTLLAESKEILSESQITLESLQPVVSELRQLMELLSKNPRILEISGKLMENLLEALRESNQMIKSGALSNVNQIGGVANRIKTEIRGFLLDLLLIGALLILFTGIVYVLAKLTYEHYSTKKMLAAKPTKKKDAA